MLNYQEFEARCMEKLQEQYPDSSVHIRDVSRTNRMSRGIVVTEPERKQIQPILYLEPFYQEYCQDPTPKGLEQVLQELAGTYDQAFQEAPGIDPQMWEDFDQLRDKLTYGLINYRRNQEQLLQMPYERIGDYAKVYQVDLGYGVCKINHEMMRHYGISRKQLEEAVLESPKRKEIWIKPMEEVLRNLIGEDFPLPSQEPPRMYVVRYGDMGAGAICDPQVQETLAGIFQDGYYILPSSRHEVLVVSKDQDTLQELEAMVRNVNQSMVDPQDYLGEQLLTYDAKEKRLHPVQEPHLTMQKKGPVLS